MLINVASDLSPDDLISIARFSPHLERLKLNLCGRLDDTVLEEWGKGFKELKYLSLYGRLILTLVRHARVLTFRLNGLKRHI